MTKHIEAVAETIAEDDATIAAALESASIPTLMMAMIHITSESTGDSSILSGGIKPQTVVLGEVQGFLSEEDKAAVRAQALGVLKAYRDGGGSTAAVR